MSDLLAHRGPDGSGEAHLEAIHPEISMSGWMGHRRLRVLDPTARADQPLLSTDGAICLSYNGEIYNFQELRRELRTVGHVFKSSGDSEVVLRAYEAWGPDFVERLDGMFALAIWDANAPRLLLARDRTGKKPLYFTAAGGGITFASEAKALFACPWVPREADLTTLGELLVFGYVPNPRTSYREIRQVEPASRIVYDRDGLGGTQRYWTALPQGTDIRAGPGVYPQIRELLGAAVRKRLESDVPLGALLSGGIDSSLVVALMSEAATEPVHTFSIGFPEDPSFDERSHARLVANHFKTKHTEFEVSVDAVELLDSLVWHHDQPFADSSAVPTYLVSELARQYVTVALNGDGGDEVFGGYDRFRAAALSRRLPARAATGARALANFLPRSDSYYSFQRRAARFLELADAPVRARYQSWISVFQPGEAVGVLAPEARQAVGDDLTASMEEKYAQAVDLPDLDRILFANFTTYLPDDLAVKMDRMSMANSLETRSPFLDTALIELLARIPARFKVGRFHVKPLLRSATFDMIPRSIWNRRKHGFGVPISRWFDGPLGIVFQDEVLGRDARSATVVDSQAARRLWTEHKSGKRPNGARLWMLLTLERWLRMLEAPPTQHPDSPLASGRVGQRSSNI